MANIDAWIAHMEALKHDAERELDEMARSRDDRSRDRFSSTLAYRLCLGSQIYGLKQELKRREGSRPENVAASEKRTEDLHAKWHEAMFRKGIG